MWLRKDSRPANPGYRQAQQIPKDGLAAGRGQRRESRGGGQLGRDADPICIQDEKEWKRNVEEKEEEIYFVHNKLGGLNRLRTLMNEETSDWA